MALQQKVLQECTKILLEIENARNPELEADAFEHILSQRYNKYKQRKQMKHKEYLPLHEFVALCSITADRSSDKPFLFEKTKLSFTIMCSNCDARQELMINLKQFEKWATKLYPLATKQNCKRIFLALASDSNYDHGDDAREHDTRTTDDTDRKSSFGRLRQRVTDAYQNKSASNSTTNLTKLTSKHEIQSHDKTVYGGITMQRFCGYVNELITNYQIEQNECQGIKISLESHLRSMSERILYHIRGVSDMTGLPPYYGFVILTDYHLIFQGTALTTRTTCIKLSDAKLEIGRAKIGGFLKRDTALRVCCSSGTFTWNVVNIRSLRRDQLYWSIWTMVRAHELASNVKRILNENDNTIRDDALLQKIKRRIIVEAADDVLRQNALQNLMLVQNKSALKFDAVPFVRFATLSEKKQYVLNIRNELNDIEMATKQTSTQQSGITLSSIFTPITGIINKTDRKEENYMDPLLVMESRKYSKLQSDFERDSKLEKLKKIQGEKREEFDLREFFKYIKILRIEVEPLIFLHRLYLCIVLWKNKGLSMFIFLCLELAIYCDMMQYVPALLFIANGILLISMRNDMEYTLQCADAALIFAGFDADDFNQEEQLALQYAQKYKNLDEKNKGWKWAIMHKIKSARYSFYYNRFSMGFHQKKLARLSVWLGRWRTIYKWHKVDKSQTACLVSMVIGTSLLMVPARYVFAVVVAGLFFKDSPFRSVKAKKKKGAFDAYFESIPPDIPQMDSEDEDEEDEDEEEDSEEGEEEDEDIDEESTASNDEKTNKMKKIKKQIHKMKKTISAGSVQSAVSTEDTDA